MLIADKTDSTELIETWIRNAQAVTKFGMYIEQDFTKSSAS